MYLLLLSVIYLAFVSLGLPDSLLGAAWPTMYESWNVPISYMGFVSMIISGSTIVSSLQAERLTRRFRTGAVTTVSVCLTAIALFGFSTATEFWHLCLWGIPYGLGAGCIDAALNNYVALYYNSRHMSWLHCFWGVGTIVSPYIMSYALTLGTWTAGYRMISLLQLGIALVLLLAMPLWRVNREVSHQEESVEPLGIRGALKIRGVPTLLLAFLAYCAAESTATLWASSYLEGVRGLSKEDAAACGALVFIGITVGRFLAGFVSERLGDSKMILTGTCVAFLGVALTAVPYTPAAIVGFVVIGLGYAPIYPSIIHSTPAHFGAENSQGIISIQMACAYLGCTFMPPLFGLLANHISLKLMPLFLGFFLILLLTMHLRTEKICK